MTATMSKATTHDHHDEQDDQQRDGGAEEAHDLKRPQQRDGAEEAYDLKRPHRHRGRSLEGNRLPKNRGGEEETSTQSPTSRKRSSSTPSTTRTPLTGTVTVPSRRAAIGAAQELEVADYEFLRQAYEFDLPLVMTQRNPKSKDSLSRHRYELYKSARNLREAVKLGATWNDIRWDYSRGWCDFSPTAKSHAADIEELIERRRRQPINETPGSYVNEHGIAKTSNLFSGLTFEESIQQDYAIMGMEYIEQMTHREQRLLQKALAGQTLAEFAHCCAARIMIPEPLNVKDAMASEHAAEWRAAMEKEIDMLTKFHCFDIVPRSDALKHGKLVKSKWVFKCKYLPSGEVERFKARLVACGYSQRPGDDYVEGATYSPVFSYTSLRTILSKAVQDDFQQKSTSSTCTWRRPTVTPRCCHQERRPRFT